MRTNGSARKETDGVWGRRSSSALSIVSVPYNLRGQRVRTGEKLMVFFDAAVKKAIGGEGIERLIHDMISKGMSDAAHAGKNDVEIAAAGLKAAEHQDIFDKVAHDVPGLTSTMFSAAIAAKLQGVDFDKLLPGNTHPGVTAAKFFLKDIAPHIIIGAGEGFGDKLSDAIDRAVGKVRSNP